MKSSTSITHESCEGSISSTREDKEFKETIKNARKKLETPVAPCYALQDLSKNNQKCGNGASDKAKSKLACISGSQMNPQDCVWENSVPNYHEDLFAGKGDNSLQHYNLVHTLILMHQAMKIPAAPAAVDK